MNNFKNETISILLFTVSLFIFLSLLTFNTSNSIYDFYNLFYEIYSKLSEIDVPKKAGDFCLMNRKVVKNLNSLNEKNLFIRGLRSWVGFKQTGIEYERDERFLGKTNFSFSDIR